MSTTAFQLDRTSANGSAADHNGHTSPIATLAESLGWGSLGLGVPMTTVPGRFLHSIGVRDDRESRMWTLVVGAREHAAAAGILALGRPRPVAWLWARVAGDAMDLALLGTALGSKSESRGRTIGAIGAVAAITVADVLAALGMTKDPEQRLEGDRHHVRTAITVRAPREEIYRFWHDFENFPRFMTHLESVRVTGDRRSHWKAKGPGRTVEWDAEVVDDRPNELIAWRSLPGADVEHSGRVRFVDAPGDRGTEIHVEMEYTAPGGVLGEAVAKLAGEEPEQQASDDLRRFKQIVETGIVVRSEGSPEGHTARRLLKQRPAQPLPAGAHNGSH
jgi:uncharacterized membrane protein